MCLKRFRVWLGYENQVPFEIYECKTGGKLLKILNIMYFDGILSISGHRHVYNKVLNGSMRKNLGRRKKNTFCVCASGKYGPIGLKFREPTPNWTGYNIENYWENFFFWHSLMYIL